MLDQIFDSGVQDFKIGRIFDYSTLSPESNGLFETIHEVADIMIKSAQRSLPGLPEITFRFINSDAVNAVAFKREGQYFIGLTNTAAITILVVINRLMSDPLVLTSIGDPSEEIQSQGLISESNYRAILNEWVNQRPKNIARHKFALEIYTRAIQFLLGHEVAHITRGHIDYLDSTFGTASILEAHQGGTPYGAVQVLERQCLEIDADRRSISARVFSIYKDWIRAKESGMNLTEARREPHQLFFDLGLSVNLFFRMFGDAPYFKNQQIRDYHPPHAIRRIISMGSIGAHASQTWGKDITNFALERYTESITALEEAFEQITEESPSNRQWGGLAQAASPDGAQTIDQIIDYWDSKLEAKLRPFSFENN